MTHADWLQQVRFGTDGLVPVVAQEHLSGDLLMLGWANRAALSLTLESGQAHYWSRSRQTLWRKGESSGHTQRVTEIRLDCDQDAVLYRVTQLGPACHTGRPTCFASAILPQGTVADGPDPGGHLLSRLDETIATRVRERPAGSYTVQLLEHGVAKVAQKVGEEAVEVVVAATAEDPARLASESADLLYHLLVLLRARGVGFREVLQVLEERER